MPLVHTAGNHVPCDLQMRGQELKEANSLAQGHTALGGWIGNLIQVSLTPKPVAVHRNLVSLSEIWRDIFFL